jgi:hypothetical protein
MLMEIAMSINDDKAGLFNFSLIFSMYYVHDFSVSCIVFKMTFSQFHDFQAF